MQERKLRLRQKQKQKQRIPQRQIPARIPRMQQIRKPKQMLLLPELKELMQPWKITTMILL